ncbi:hypothetical protein HELRODRAFT_181350 [Helobdella robusta]|uniref:Uncharacterized protein n=1 Tax=Helobdella robusta TaxID=6412 RepID=T1FGX1_HELRO|nr:hypothetical protein HELRODRAFT_181350 [Helobdella robusta]ESN92478.1 hypothetical protein HELRODRAFT_181350 [Helobdella robusta]
MEIDVKYSLFDALINWFLFTPLVVAFWCGTYGLIDILLFDLIDSRQLATIFVLLFGVSIEFTITYWQDKISEFARELTGIKFAFFSRGYNYVLATANICHYRAIQEVYDSIFGPENFGACVQTAVTSIVLLWSLRAGRNITALPFCVSLDSETENWFSAPTLYQRYSYLCDVIITVMCVWSLAPLHWITFGYFLDHVIFPDFPELSSAVSCLLGYTVVAVFSYYQYEIRNWSKYYDNEKRMITKTFLENFFIWGATAGVIATWKGLGMAIDMTSKAHPIYLNDVNISSLCLNVISFTLLSLCHVSASLVAKGAEMDGSIANGDGVEFSRLYLRHFYEDYIKKEKAASVAKSKID